MCIIGHWKIIEFNCCTEFLFSRSQLLPEKKALLIPLESSAVGILSLNTTGIEFTLNPSKLSHCNKLGTVMAMKPVTEELILIVYEGGQLLLWDIKTNGVINSLVVEEYPMTFDFDVSLMQGIVGSASDKLEVNGNRFPDQHFTNNEY